LQPQSLGRYIVTFLGKTDYTRTWNEEVVASLQSPCRNSRRSNEEKSQKFLGVVSITGDYRKNLIHCCTADT